MKKGYNKMDPTDYGDWPLFILQGNSPEAGLFEHNCFISGGRGARHKPGIKQAEILVNNFFLKENAYHLPVLKTLLT